MPCGTVVTAHCSTRVLIYYVKIGSFAFFPTECALPSFIATVAEKGVTNDRMMSCQDNSSCVLEHRIMEFSGVI